MFQLYVLYIEQLFIYLFILEIVLHIKFGIYNGLQVQIRFLNLQKFMCGEKKAYSFKTSFL